MVGSQLEIQIRQLVGWGDEIRDDEYYGNRHASVEARCLSPQE